MTLSSYADYIVIETIRVNMSAAINRAFLRQTASMRSTVLVYPVHINKINSEECMF